MADQPAKTVAQKQEPSSAVPLPSDVQASVEYVQTYCQHFGPRDQHNAFHVQLASKGWSYGVSVDVNGKKHPWVTHWKKLPADERVKQATLFNQKG